MVSIEPQWLKSGTSSPTSSGCGERWTSCSATSSIAALSPRRRGGFSPAVDVYYASDPPRAVVRADLAGIDPNERPARDPRAASSSLSGQREPEGADDRVYQQLEIEHGPFRRVVSLGAEVDADAADATYEDGILTVELPLAGRRGRAPSRSAGARVSASRGSRSADRRRRFREVP